MAATDIEIPQDVLDLLKRSKLGRLPLADHVRVALAIQLFQEGVISIGRAAEIAHQSQREMEALLQEIGVPSVRYEIADYARELAAAEKIQTQEA